MARIRSIKPDFFLHEDLAELSPLHRLLFIGLWTLADKRGVLENRPKRIKAALLPWEECDVEALLADLERGGFIVRYEADGEPCLFIPGFERHQRPHPREPQNEHPLPGSDVLGREKTRLAVNGQASIPATSSRKGREGSGGGEGKEASAGADIELSEEPFGPPPPDLDHSIDLFQLWNRTAPPALPVAREFSEARRKKAKARLKERPLPEWEAVILRMVASPFCRGETSRDGWRADFDFLLKPDTAAKVLEGKYDGRATGPPKPAALDVGRSAPAGRCAIDGEQGEGGEVWGHFLCAWHVSEAIAAGIDSSERAAAWVREQREQAA